MGTNENRELELLLKQLTRNYINEQLQQLKNMKKDNNSFIFLESNTLNMLIVYLLTSMEAQNSDNTTNSKENEFFLDELIEELDSVIFNNKKEFEEILSLLKEKT